MIWNEVLLNLNGDRSAEGDRKETSGYSGAEGWPVAQAVLRCGSTNSPGYTRFAMSRRALGRICVALFALSTAFPVSAGILNLSRPPRWLGVADVVVAAILFCAVAVLAGRGRGAVTDRHRLAAQRATQGIIGVIPALLVAYFAAGDRVNWTVLIIGLAWRGWLLLYSLPSLAEALLPGVSSGEQRINQEREGR